MILLISNSPQRKKILSNNGYNVKVVNNSFDESSIKVLNNPREYVRNLARGKLDNYLKGNDLKDENVLILTADTIVYLNNKYYGKPKNSYEAHEMISELSGNTHHVLTGVALYYNKKCYTITDKSAVTFKLLNHLELSNYANSGKWEGKAGGYGIQEENGIIANYQGDITNIIGLPIVKLEKLFNKINYKKD